MKTFILITPKEYHEIKSMAERGMQDPDPDIAACCRMIFYTARKLDMDDDDD